MRAELLLEAPSTDENMERVCTSAPTGQRARRTAGQKQNGTRCQIESRVVRAFFFLIKGSESVAFFKAVGKGCK